MSLDLSWMKQDYDLAILGGGINGAAIARDAALRGLNVVLLEKEDFGSGASTKTSKLVHGGLRYLENYEFGLVRESLHERALLLINAPHLVTPQPFVIPFYADDPCRQWVVKLGLYVYDFLDQGGSLPRHTNLTPNEVISLFPGIKKEGLKGGCIYYDALMKDNRLVMENILAAEKNGAVVQNYTEATKLVKEQGRIVGLNYQSKTVEGTLKAKAVVNATGAWANRFLQENGKLEPFQVGPTKGTHLVIPEISSQYALILRTPQDQRIFFLIPWQSNTLLGTTDTSYDGSPDQVAAEKQDKEYLLKAFLHYFPQFRSVEPISAFAGLRPLLGSIEKNPSSISRRHGIHVSESGLISVLGGKYTTHREVAEETVNRVYDILKGAAFKKSQTQNLPFAGNPQSFSEFAQECDHCGLSEQEAEHLFFNYGDARSIILGLIKQNKENAKPLCSLHPHFHAELVYALKHEHVRTLEDWFFRRTSIAYLPCKGKLCVERASQSLSSFLNWSEEERKNAVATYLSKL